MEPTIVTTFEHPSLTNKSRSASMASRCMSGHSDPAKPRLDRGDQVDCDTDERRDESWMDRLEEEYEEGREEEPREEETDL